VKSLTEKATPVEKVKTTLKRRVGYTEEHVSITRAKLEGMEIDTEGNDGREERDEPEENTATAA
jgi:hypothetical protein